MYLRYLQEYTKLPNAPHPHPNDFKNNGEETVGETLGITIKFAFTEKQFPIQPLGS